MKIGKTSKNDHHLRLEEEGRLSEMGTQNFWWLRCSNWVILDRKMLYILNKISKFKASKYMAEKDLII